jgi:RNA polymerase sigma-70 factor (ECF subfamily)
MYDDVDDFELLARCRSGDGDAGDALIQRHMPQLCSFLLPRAGPQTADLVHQTFLVILREAGVPTGRIRNFPAYLMGIARNQFLMWQRRKAIEHRCVNAIENDPAARKSSVTTPSEGVARKEERDLISQELRQLPDQYQTTLELFYWHNFSVQEIADIMKSANGTVKSRLSRGKRLLEERLRAAGVRE